MTLGAGKPFVTPEARHIAQACADRYAMEQQQAEARRVASGLPLSLPPDFGRAAVYQIVLEECRKALREG